MLGKLYGKYIDFMYKISPPVTRVGALLLQKFEDAAYKKWLQESGR